MTFRPIPPPTAWWDTTTITGLSSGDRITHVDDSSGSGNSLVPSFYVSSQGAIYTPDVVNGFPAMTFSGVGTYMGSTLDAGVSAITALVVVKPSSTAGNRHILDGEASGSIGIRTNGTSLQIVSRAVSAGTLLPAGSISNNSAQILSFRWNGSTAQGFKNGAGGSPLSFGASVTSGRNTVVGGGNAAFLGDILEVIIYHSYLDSEELAVVHSYYQDKYDIEVSDYVPFAPSSGIKVYTGNEFLSKPLKVWTGTSWEQKPVKHWNGSDWV